MFIYSFVFKEGDFNRMRVQRWKLKQLDMPETTVFDFSISRCTSSTENSAKRDHDYLFNSD